MLRILRTPVYPDRNTPLDKKHQEEDETGFDEQHPVQVERLDLRGIYEDQNREKYTYKDVGDRGGEESLEIPVLLFGDIADKEIYMGEEGYLEYCDKKERNHSLNSY
jgi:hypothetical protein